MAFFYTLRLKQNADFHDCYDGLWFLLRAFFVISNEQRFCNSDEGGISWSCTKGNYTICASSENVRSINFRGDHKDETVKAFSIKGLGRFAYGYQSMNVNYFVREAAITGSTFAFQNKQRCLLIQQAFLLISTYENNCVLHH